MAVEAAVVAVEAAVAVLAAVAAQPGQVVADAAEVEVVPLHRAGFCASVMTKQKVEL